MVDAFDTFVLASPEHTLSVFYEFKSKVVWAAEAWMVYNQGINVCNTVFEQTQEAWEARAIIDTAMGLRNRSDESVSMPRSSGAHKILSVVFAGRQPHGDHSRVIVNQRELIQECHNTRLNGFQLHCAYAWFDGDQVKGSTVTEDASHGYHVGG